MNTDELRNALYRLAADAVTKDFAGRSLGQSFSDLVKGLGLATSGVARDTPGSGGAGSGGSKESFEGAATLLARHLAELASASRNQTETVEANTRAVIENSLARAAEGKGSTAGSIAKTVLSFLGSGLGLVRLIGGLFGGGGEAADPELPRFVLPAPVQLAAAWTASGIQPLRYAQDGLPQAAPVVRQTPITIEVRAMDSRSFLDHSSEIARAVKEALLQSHSLSDVVADL